MKMAGILPVVAGRRQCRREKDKEVPEMFQPGDLVVYGSSGVDVYKRQRRDMG